MNRRLFLTGIVVGAVTGAVGANYLNKKSAIILPQSEQVYYLLGMINRIGAFSPFSKKIKDWDDSTKSLQEEASVNMRSLPPAQAKLLRTAFDKGWDDGQILIDHSSANSKSNDPKLLSIELENYAENYMKKLFKILNHDSEVVQLNTLKK
jgi:hypothetical protein